MLLFLQISMTNKNWKNTMIFADKIKQDLQLEDVQDYTDGHLLILGKNLLFMTKMEKNENLLLWPISVKMKRQQ